jgi:hypothetical protein
VRIILGFDPGGVAGAQPPAATFNPSRDLKVLAKISTFLKQIGRRPVFPSQ